MGLLMEDYSIFGTALLKMVKIFVTNLGLKIIFAKIYIRLHDFIEFRTIILSKYMHFLQQFFPKNCSKIWHNFFYYI